MDRVPLPIEEVALDASTTPDETGFSTCEKVALRNAWSLIRANFNEHCKYQFITFFLEHEELVNRFRLNGPEINMRILHSHTKNLFCAISSIIYEGLDSKIRLHGIISPITKHHSSIPLAEIQLMSFAVGDYLKGVLKRYLSPTLDNSINKICQVIVKAHE